MSWRSPLQRFVPRHTVQGALGGESMATTVNLTDFGFESSLPGHKTRTSTNLGGREFVILNSILTSVLPNNTLKKKRNIY